MFNLYPPPFLSKQKRRNLSWKHNVFPYEYKETGKHPFVSYGKSSINPFYVYHPTKSKKENTRELDSKNNGIKTTL